MTALLIKRLGFALVTMFAVMTIVFFVLRILPGDPAYAILGDQANEQSLAALRERLGLNLPLYQQYFEFMKGAIVGDWGTSLVSNRPVLQDIFDVMPDTLELTFASLLLGAVIGIPVGIWSAIRRNKMPDYVARTISLIGLSFPAFVSAVLLLLVFSIQLRWFPVISSGQGDSFAERMRDLALPAINLGLIMAAYITRVTRSAMLEVLNQDYVRTAQAKGSSRAVIIWRHCFRNSMIPVVTVVGLYLGILIGNSVLTEIVFNRPGLGMFLIVVLMALLAPVIAPHDPIEQNIFDRLEGPSSEYWLGTDAFGRDIFSRIVWGARISLAIAVFSIAAAMIVGTIIGLLASYIGGRFDVITMQVMDVLLAFPGLIVVAMLGPSITNLAVAIAITAVPPFVRIARAPTIAIKDREFIDAGRALGFSDRRLVFGHILPIIAPEVVVMGSLWLATAIRVEASLAFVGLGVNPPTPTWGGMIREGFENILDSYWLALCPSIAILIVVLGLNLLGDGLRDAVDPRLKGEE